MLKEVRHRLTPASSGGVTFHGAAEHGTHLETVSANGRPVAFTTGSTALVDSGVGNSAVTVDRVFDDDIAIMKRLCMLDARADDSKNGLIYGAATPRITATFTHTIGTDTNDIPTPVGGSMSVDDMRRFGIAGSFGYIGAGARRVSVVSPYMGVVGGGHSSTSGLSVDHHDIDHPVFETVAAGNRLGVVVKFRGYGSGSEKYVSCGLGGTVTITVRYVAVAGNDPEFSLIGIGQDGRRVTLATMIGDVTDANEVNTVTMSASAMESGMRLAAAYMVADRSLSVSTGNGVLTCGNSSRSDLQCVMSIEGTASNDTVTFEGSSLYVGAPAEPSLTTHENDEGVDLNAIVARFMSDRDAAGGYYGMEN